MGHRAPVSVPESIREGLQYAIRLRLLASRVEAAVVKKGAQPRNQRVDVLEFAFPHHENLPLEGFELGAHLGVALLVPLKFWKPVFEPGLRGPAIAAFVCMPETAVHEYHLPSGWKDKIRFTRKIPAMEPIAIPEAVQAPPNRPFRSSVPSPDRLHRPAALLRG